mmetsp:Transcript_2427/g.3530  ORF Transcript_2427/g.3530 Transcript_2427/m.3530 type:complete len:486 (-) Transcript_2427:90-1547(-)
MYRKGKHVYGTVTSEVLKLLSELLESDSIITTGLEQYSRDRSIYAGRIPQVAVLPKSTEEVSRIVKICAKYKIPITTRGAGTGLEGGAIPMEGGLVISTENLRNVRIDVVNMHADVGAGVYKNELNDELKKKGLIFGPDPASNPSIGGMVSTSGSGLSTMRYGTTRENVISLIVVTPQGEIVRTRQKVRKASTGYELTQLYIGSEGTLGIVTEVTVKIHPIQKYRAGVVCRFSSLHSAASAVVAMLKIDRSSLVRCELLNSMMVEATNAAYKTSLAPKPTLFLEFQANDIQVIRTQWKNLSEIVEKYGAGEKPQYSEQVKGIEKLWGARRGCYFSTMKYRKLTQGRKEMDKVYITDVCVPIGNLAQCIGETEADFKNLNVPCLICAHIADGNFHCMLPYRPVEKSQLKAAEQKLIERAVRLGGAVSGEHGVGIGKRRHICLEHGKTHLDLQEKIKRALDPDLIMNPQKVLDLGYQVKSLKHRSKL